MYVYLALKLRETFLDKLFILSLVLFRFRGSSRGGWRGGFQGNLRGDNTGRDRRSGFFRRSPNGFS